MQKNQQPHLKLPGVAALTWVIVAQYVSFPLSPTLPLPQNASSPPHPKLPLTSPLPGALSNLQAAEHQCFTGILAFAAGTELLQLWHWVSAEGPQNLLYRATVTLSSGRGPAVRTQDWALSYCAPL